MPAEGIARRHVEDKQMIAEFVEAADVAAHQRGGALRDRAAFLIKDLVAQPLRLAHFFLRGGEPDLEIAEAAEHARQAGEIAPSGGAAHTAAVCAEIR